MKARFATAFPEKNTNVLKMVHSLLHNTNLIFHKCNWLMVSKKDFVATENGLSTII